MIEVNRQKFDSAAECLQRNMQTFCCFLLLIACFQSFGAQLLHPQTNHIFALNDGCRIEILASNGKVCRIKCQRIVNLVPAQANRCDYISSCVCFREHIFDFETGIDVPLWNVVVLHRLNVFLCQCLVRLPLSDNLHDFKGHRWVQTMVNQIEHDAVSGSDYLADGAGSALNQILRVAQPNIGSV